MKGFTLKEKEKLISMAKDSKVKGYSLTKVFSEFAKETERASGSVRNYYYELIKSDEELFADLQASVILPFTKCETANILTKVLVGASEGKSIRKVIKELAQTDKEALRMQNKYRNVIKNERPFVEAVMRGLDKKGVKYLNPYKKQREKRTFIYNRLKREINGLLEKMDNKEKLLNKELAKKIEELQQENKVLKEQSNVVKFLSLKNKELVEKNS